MLVLNLKALPFDRVRGAYTIFGHKDRMPARALFLHPKAADSFMADIAPHVGVSDILRSAESSLNAVKTGRGAQRPGRSGHNFGFSIDLRDVGEAIREMALHDKPHLDSWMAACGWYCHRTDGARGFEEWHFNYFRLAEDLGRPAIVPAGKYTSDELEAMIQAVYGAELSPADIECQALLAKLGLYHGGLDGDIGHLSREATKAFQRAWMLAEDGALGPETRRTLAFVACEREVE